MNRKEYVSKLKRRLSKLPNADVKKYVDFFNEIIDDRIEEGLSEEEALAQSGTPQEFAEQILAECGVKTRKMKTWELVLLIAGSPVWFSLVVALAAIVLSLYISLWAVDICLWAADLCFAACGFAGLVAGVALIATGYFPQGLFLIGSGLICVSLGIFWFLLCDLVSNEIIKLSKTLFKLPKRIFKGKEIAE